MKLTLFLFFIALFNIQANNYAQNTKVSLELKNVTLEKVFNEIESLTDFKFLFNRKDIDVNKIVSVSVKDEKIKHILNDLFLTTPVSYEVLGKQIIIKYDGEKQINQRNVSNIIVQQQRLIKGTVVDAFDQPLPGANVLEKGTTNGTVTDFDGNFILEVADENAVLVISYLGFITQEITVGQQTALSIKLEEDTASLDEVVVVGYGTQKKKLNTGANLNIKGDVINKQTTTNAMEALQGISPGVSITRTSAQPGAATRVYIRGIGTIGDASPLYIVDGVIVNNIDYLSPSDIEAIDVLKDAASAAIYGSRAANGVILVTTKKGKSNEEGSFTVNLDAYIGLQNVYNQPEMLNAQEFMEIQNEGRLNDGKTPYDFEQIVGTNIWNKLNNGWKGTNWFDEMKIKNGSIRNFVINITGGSKRSVYSFGTSYNSNEGVFGEQSNSEYKRLTVRMNSEHILFKGENDLNIIKFGENLTYTNIHMPSVRLGNIYSNDIHSAIVTHPLMPVYDENGEYQYALGPPYEKQSNPVALMEYNTKNSSDNRNNLVGNFYLEIQPIINLIIRSSYGFQISDGSYRNWIPKYDLGEYKQTPYDKVIQRMYKRFEYTFTNTVSYRFNLNEIHNFTFLLGTEMNKLKQSLSISGSNQDGLYNDPDYAYLDNYPVIDPSLTKISGSDRFGHSVLSYFGRMSYNYDEKYLLTLVARADGSSNFAKGNRWGFFPSISAGWVVTNEDFMGNNNIIDFLKLRASWGQNGNQNIGSFQYSSTISTAWADYFFGPDKSIIHTGGYPARVPNPDVTWETSQQTDIGFDMYVLDSRLTFNFDWYQKDTKDWLVVAPIVATAGADPSAINGGKIRNRGIELALGWNERSKDFKYSITGTFAYNKNEVVEIENGEGIIHGSTNVMFHGMSEIYRAQVGFPIGYFWGFTTDGIIQNQDEADEYNNRITSDPRKYTPVPGDFRYVDQNNDGIIDDNDKTMLGDPNPRYNFGLQINLEYKGFYVNMTGTGQGGMKISQSYRSWNFETENYTAEVFDRWHGEGTSNTFPKLSSIGNQNMLQMSDFFIKDASYFRISNLTLGYNFGAIKNSPFKNIKLYVVSKNLATFTSYNGMDPEVGYAPDSWASGIDLGMYPNSKSFLLGINLNF